MTSIDRNESNAFSAISKRKVEVLPRDEYADEYLPARMQHPPQLDASNSRR